MWDLILSAPDHCLSFYFVLVQKGYLKYFQGYGIPVTLIP